jgi:hypothetical protein
MVKKERSVEILGFFLLAEKKLQWATLEFTQFADVASIFLLIV